MYQEIMQPWCCTHNCNSHNIKSLEGYFVHEKQTQILTVSRTSIILLHIERLLFNVLSQAVVEDLIGIALLSR
jgi:hypothetical protein